MQSGEGPLIQGKRPVSFSVESTGDSQIKFNRKDGTIELPNGKYYKAKVTTSDGGSYLDATQIKLIEQIVAILNQTQDMDHFTYGDLSQTKITKEGIETNQEKPNVITYIEPANYTVRYQEIADLTRDIMRGYPAKTADDELEILGIKEPALVEVSFQPLAERKIAQFEVAPAEEKRVERAAFPVLKTIGNFFRRLPGIVLSGIKTLGIKIADFFKKILGESQGTKKTEELAQELSPLLVEEPDVSFNWDKVSLEQLDRLMREVAQKQTKLKVREGILRSGTRHMGLKGQVGTSDESRNVVQGMLKRLNRRLWLLQTNAPAEGVKVTHQMIADALKELEIVESILKSIKASEWGAGVLEHDDVSRNAMEAILRTHVSVKQTYIGGKAEALPKAKALTTLFNPESTAFRRQYLTNYRLFYTTKDFFTVLLENYKKFEASVEKANAAVPDANGKITMESGGKLFSYDKAAMIKGFRGQQQGILEVCKEWLSDPFINNGEAEIDNPIWDLINEIALRAGYAKAFEALVSDIANLLLEKEDAPFAPHVEANSLVSKSQTPYSEQIYRLSIGENVERESLLEQMSEEIFKADQYLLSQIKSSEFVKQAWQKRKENAPNILNMITHFNKIQEYVRFCIIGLTTAEIPGEDTKLKNRVRIEEFFIDLMDKLIEKNDFNAALTILSAFASSEIARLTNTWESVDAKYKAKHEKAQALLSHVKNYALLREKYEEIKKKEGALYVPFLGRILADYLFADESWKAVNEEDKIVLSTIEGFTSIFDNLRLPQQRIAAAASEKPNYFVTDSDLFHEMDKMAERAEKILTDIKAPHAGEIAPKLRENIEFALYEQSLIIEPRAVKD